MAVATRLPPRPVHDRARPVWLSQLASTRAAPSRPETTSPSVSTLSISPASSSSSSFLPTPPDEQPFIEFAKPPLFDDDDTTLSDASDSSLSLDGDISSPLFALLVPPPSVSPPTEKPTWERRPSQSLSEEVDEDPLLRPRPSPPLDEHATPPLPPTDTAGKRQALALLTESLRSSLVRFVDFNVQMFLSGGGWGRGGAGLHPPVYHPLLTSPPTPAPLPPINRKGFPSVASSESAAFALSECECPHQAKAVDASVQLQTFSSSGGDQSPENSYRIMSNSFHLL
jgi:hypothetical protein